MTESKAERFDADLRWNAISEKRRKEFGALLYKFHLEDVRAGRATAEGAIELFRDSLGESRRRYDANPTDWATWVSEQEEGAHAIEQAMTYSLHREKLGDDVRPGRYICLDITRAEAYLESVEDLVDVPAYPECYRPHMNWAASDWMLLHELPDGNIYPRGVSFLCIDRLPKRLKILGNDQDGELRYCVLRLAYALTDSMNPDSDRYHLEHPISGMQNQIPGPLREDIAVAFHITEHTAARWLKNMGFELPPNLKFPKRNDEELAGEAKKHRLDR